MSSIITVTACYLVTVYIASAALYRFNRQDARRNPETVEVWSPIVLGIMSGAWPLVVSGAILAGIWDAMAGRSDAAE